MDDFIEDEDSNNVDFTSNFLKKGEYDNCTFSNCDFSNSNLSSIIFNDCQFTNCNLSMVKLAESALRVVKFKDCKILGVFFEKCNPFGMEVSFENTILNHSSFYQLNLKNTNFKNTQCHEVDFTEANLTNSIFDNCDLLRTNFVNSVLEKVNFSSSYNLYIDPEINKLKKAKFSLDNISGLLKKYEIEIL